MDYYKIVLNNLNDFHFISDRFLLSLSFPFDFNDDYLALHFHLSRQTTAQQSSSESCTFTIVCRELPVISAKHLAKAVTCSKNECNDCISGTQQLLQQQQQQEIVEIEELKAKAEIDVSPTLTECNTQISTNRVNLSINLVRNQSPTFAESCDDNILDQISFEEGLPSEAVKGNKTTEPEDRSLRKTNTKSSSDPDCRFKDHHSPGVKSILFIIFSLLFLLFDLFYPFSVIFVAKFESENNFRQWSNRSNTLCYCR